MSGARSRRSPRKSTHERILDAAETHFARHGYGATSLAQIADDVELRVPSLYKHFESKRALYMAVVQRLLAPHFELLEGLLTVPKDAAHAQYNLRSVVLRYMHTPNLARLVQHAALAGGDELRLIVEHWYDPLFRRAAGLFPPGLLNGAGNDQRALRVVVAFHSLMSGYVTMAPLHTRLTARDALAEDAICAQVELMQRLAAELFQASLPGSARGRSAQRKRKLPEPSSARRRKDARDA